MCSGMRRQVVIYDSLMTIKAYWLLKVKRVSPKPPVSKGNASTEMKTLLVKPFNGVFDFYITGLMLFFFFTVRKITSQLFKEIFRIRNFFLMVLD